MDVRRRWEALWTRAVEIFGSEIKADCWFNTRLSELADRTPEAVLEEDAGIRQLKRSWIASSTAFSVDYSLSSLLPVAPS